MAMSILGRQQFIYYAFASRSLNQLGQDIPVYDTPVSLFGSVQPIPRNLYQEYGLDFDRYYLTFYVSRSVMDVARDVSGDAFAFNEKYYQCLSKTDWFPQDGWVALLAVQVPSIPGLC